MVVSWVHTTLRFGHEALEFCFESREIRSPPTVPQNPFTEVDGRPGKMKNLASVGVSGHSGPRAHSESRTILRGTDPSFLLRFNLRTETVNVRCAGPTVRERGPGPGARVVPCEYLLTSRHLGCHTGSLRFSLLG